MSSWRRPRRIAVVLIGLLVVAVGAGVWMVGVKPLAPDIEVSAPGPTGRRIATAGVFGNFYPASVAPAPAVLVLGGSEGGIGSSGNLAAADLQGEGFNVLVVSYFGAPGQRKALELVPLETFDRALTWLRSQPEVDPTRLAVAGQSKGAEAALLVGTRHPELRAVVAGAPTVAVWPGITYRPFAPKSSWTIANRPMATLPYDGIPFFGDIGRVYNKVFGDLSEHPDAAIRVEKITGPLLLLCGEADKLWPSCPMARRLQQRANDRDGPVTEVLAYRDAGHSVLGPVRIAEGSRLTRWGGSVEATRKARADAWPKLVAFLRSAFAV